MGRRKSARPAATRPPRRRADQVAAADDDRAPGLGRHDRLPAPAAEPACSAIHDFGIFLEPAAGRHLSREVQ